MTERIDRADAYQREARAQVLSTREAEGQTLVLLDRSLFYAEGGGQSADTGRLWPVEDAGAVSRVLSAELQGEEVWLRLDRPLPEGVRAVECSLDWGHRFDNMQQHTGQHIFSAALFSLLRAETRSSRLGGELSTIDLDREVSAAGLQEAEELANQILAENRAVRVLYPSPDELSRMTLRREPKVEANVRVVEVEGFDLSPCGGTHVRNTSEIGLLVTLSSERYKGGTRLSFLAGRRVAREFQRRRSEDEALSRLLSAPAGEQAPAVQRLLDESAARLARIESLTEALAIEKANALLARPDAVLRVQLDGEKALARQIAQRISQTPGRAAFLGVVEGDKAALIFAAGPNAGIDAGARLKAVCAALGGRGGGRPHLAEGSCPADKLSEALAQA
jgi:alanyl-tRNA synthetase